MPAPTLRELLRRALQVSVVAPLALAGCGPDVSQYTPLQCDSAGISVAGLQPPVIPDVLSLRVSNAYGVPNEEGMPTQLSSTGTACATATDANACRASYDALNPQTGFADSCFQICSRYFLAITQGDEVRAVASLDALKAFLGDIDTAQEAMLIAFANNYNLSCGDPSRGAAKPDGDDWEVIATSGIACGAGSSVSRHYLKVARDGTLTTKRSEIIEYGQPNCAIGRRPPGLVSSGTAACDEALGRFFAEAAHLEAASVPAFAQLRAELAALGAPVELQRWALAAELEEIGHTRTTARLAARFGGAPTDPQVEARPLRGAFELALDNVVEGCVRETFGALVAQHQALHAEDPEVRAAMVGIAEDETRHAELSWAVDAWLQARLSADERLVLSRARAAAVRGLARELDVEVEEALVTQAGMPRAEVAKEMLGALFA